jgi:hypothetical protein
MSKGGKTIIVVIFVLLAPEDETFNNKKWNILHDSLTTHFGCSNLANGFQTIGSICVQNAVTSCSNDI